MANLTRDFQESQIFPTFRLFVGRVPEESRKSEKTTSEYRHVVTGIKLKPNWFLIARKFQEFSTLPFIIPKVLHYYILTLCHIIGDQRKNQDICVFCSVCVQNVFIQCDSGHKLDTKVSAQYRLVPPRSGKKINSVFHGI